MNLVAAPTLNRASVSRSSVLTRSRWHLKRKDVHSNRKHVEVISASKTRIHGEVITSQQAYQPKVLQRSPIETVVNETLNLPLVGKGLCCPKNP